MRNFFFIISCLIAITMKAQRLTHDFQNTSLSDALIWIDNAQEHYKMNFIFDELEDFTVTTTLKNATVPDAVRQVCGFYPMHLTFDGQEIYIECTQKTDTKLTGHVVDEAGQPLVYASIVLLSPADSTFLTGGVSNEAGDFVIPYESPRMGGPTAGMQEPVIARISYVGYKTLFLLCDRFGMGTIQMRPDTYTLNGVTVKGHTPQYQKGAEGLVTNVENTVLSQLGTGEDVLAHVPGVTKKQGGFEVFGKGTPVVYINGRLMRDASELSLRKSEDIKSIELITNPGARYDASVRAVVKIRTKAAQGEGFGFDVRSSYYQSENTDLIEQLNWNYRRGRLDVFGTCNYNMSSSHFPSEIVTKVETDTLWQQRFKQNYRPQRHTLSGIVGTNYLIDDDNAVGFRYTLTVRPTVNINSSLHTDITANDEYYDHLDNRLHSKVENRPSHLLNVYYKGKWGKAGIDFNADYFYNREHGEGNYAETSQSKDSRTVTSENTERNELFASKLAVDVPVCGGGLTVGAEYTHTLRNDDYINPQQYVPTSFAELRESHIAPFAEYSRQIARFQLTAGLRYEWVDFDYYENRLHLDEQSRSFGNLFPSLSIATQVGKVQMQLGYTAKTHRPTYQQLSNNVTYGNRFLMQSGNPFLRHEYIHDLSLAGVWKFVQFAVGYNDRRHTIIYWAEQQKTNSAVTRLTHKNLPSLKSVVAQIALAPKWGIWSPQLSVGMQKQWLTLHTDVSTLRMNTPVFQFRLNNTLDMGRGWLASLDAKMTTKGHFENVYAGRCNGAIDVSITKNWQGDRLSIRLQGTDLFHTDKQESWLYAGAMRSIQKSWYDSREFGATLRYKFNTTRSKYKGTGAGNAEKSRL